MPHLKRGVAALLGLAIVLLPACTSDQRDPASAASTSASSPSPTSTSPYPEALCTTEGVTGSTLTAQGDSALNNDKLDLAEKLYNTALSRTGASEVERECAARGLAQLAIKNKKPTAAPSLSKAASGWDSFYATWVSPTVRVGTPLLVLFVLLLFASRLITRWVVGPDTPGSRRYSRVFSMVATVSLLYSAFEFAVILPLLRSNSYSSQIRGIQFTAGLAVLFQIALLYVAWFVISHEREPRQSTAIMVILTLSVLVLAAMIMGTESPWTAGLLACVLGALGVMTLAWTRGTALGLRIAGHTKEGGDNPGLAQFVHDRLFALGTLPPRGIQRTQGTDVDSLPAAALKLLPEGPVSKAAALVIALATQSTPWIAHVTEQSDGSLSIVLLRNGVVADARVIHASDVALPGPSPTATTTSASASTGAASTSGAATSDREKWSVELRTAAAAFILLALSRRYDHLTHGLSGATEWRSVAAQVIATDSATRLRPDEQVALLARAVAFDGKNVAAEVAFLNTTYRVGAASRRQTWQYAVRLEAVLQNRIRHEAEFSALRLRVLFNLTVAWLNYAELVLVRGAADQDLPSRDEALKHADNYVSKLLESLQLGKKVKSLDSLVKEIEAASWYFKDMIRLAQQEAASQRKISEASPPKASSMLARYERACWLVANEEWSEALAEIDMVRHDPSIRVWARQDPFFERLHQLPYDSGRWARQFKADVGDPIPGDFLDLAPFIAHKGALQQRGIYTAVQLRQSRTSFLLSELGITVGVAHRWYTLAELYRSLTEMPPSDTNDQAAKAVGILFLLLAVNVDSIAELTPRLEENNIESFGDKLLDAARPFAVVAPTVAELRAWVAGLAR
jgi:hypothetical protein